MKKILYAISQWRRSRAEGLVSPMKLTVQTVKFHSEQVGIPERELQGQLAAAFAQMPEVRKAFLARVDYGDGVQHVALCIAGEQKRAKEIASTAGKIFHAMFRREMHLDIMALTEQQEMNIEKVCQPFYDRLANR